MQPFKPTLLAIFSFLTITSATSRFALEPRLDTDTNTNTDFIKDSCRTTRYPDLCFKTLSPYATTVQTSPTELANAALTVSLKSAKSTSRAVTQLLKGRDLSTGAGDAVAGCLENMGDSVDELQKSMVAMKDLEGPNFKEKMGDVMTWVSAALTDEGTCMDGFEENVGKKDGKIKDTIRGYIVNVAQLTSNALALINNIAST